MSSLDAFLILIVDLQLLMNVLPPSIVVILHPKVLGPSTSSTASPTMSSIFFVVGYFSYAVSGLRVLEV